jgi:hypothetical protein
MLYFTTDAMPYQYLITARSKGGLGGQSGPSAIGWGDSGRSGQIKISSTEEFFFYLPKEQAMDE